MIKKLFMVCLFSVMCSNAMCIGNPVATLGNGAIGLSVAKNMGLGLGTLASVYLFGKCFNKWEQAFTGLKFSKPENRLKNKVSFYARSAACLGWGLTACVTSALFFAHTVPEVLLKSNTISMAAAKGAGFGALAITLYLLESSRIIGPRNYDRVDKIFGGRGGFALASVLAAGGALYLSLANAGNCIQLIAGNR